MTRLLRTFVSGIERSPLPFASFLFTLAFSVAGARTLALFTSPAGRVDAQILLNDASLAAAITSVLILITHLGSGVPVLTAARVVMTASVLLPAAPLLGLLITSDLVRLATVTLLTGVAALSYCRWSGTSLIRAGAASAAAAGAVAALSMAPWLLQRLTGSGADDSLRAADAAYVLAASGAVLGLAYRADAERFSLLVADSRWPKVAHFALMLVVGVLIALNRRPHMARPGFPTAADALGLIVFILAGVLASVFSTITNNLEDIDIDRISSPHRPHVASGLDFLWYRRVGYWCLVGALFSAASVGIPALLVVLAGTGGYFAYSVPPLKLKRVPLFAKFVIALNSLLVVAAGYVYVRGSIAFFPIGVTLLALVGGTLALNVLDLKDYEGDRAAGIKTLPVLLGPTATKRLSAVAILVMYSSTLFWLRRRPGIAVTFTILGVVQAVLVTRTTYDERKVIWLHLAGLVLAGGYYVAFVHR